MTEITAGQASDAARFTAIVAELAEYIATGQHVAGAAYGITVHRGQDGGPPTHAAAIRECLASGHVCPGWTTRSWRVCANWTG